MHKIFDNCFYLDFRKLFIQTLSGPKTQKAATNSLDQLFQKTSLSKSLSHQKTHPSYNYTQPIYNHKPQADWLKRMMIKNHPMATQKGQQQQ